MSDERFFPGWTTDPDKLEELMKGVLDPERTRRMERELEEAKRIGRNNKQPQENE